MSISWGIRERFKFNASGSLISWDPPPVPAVYAITYRQDLDRPKSHTVLFFGQADNLSLQAHELNGQVIDAWKDGSNDAGELFVFIHPMPGSTIGQRFTVQHQLIDEYRPRCNR